MKFLKVNNHGQSLVEAVVAIGIVTMVLIGLVSAVNYSLVNTQYTRNKAAATKYAQEAIEFLRSERDRLGWPVFYATAGDQGTLYCLILLTTVWYTVPSPTGCPEYAYIPGTQLLTRTILLDGNGGLQDQVSVTVSVNWPQGDRNGSVVINTYINKLE